MTGSAFDGVAGGYDDRFSHQDIAKFLRAKVHRVAASYLVGPSHMLEIGCGTGVDACHFAAKGHAVMATDPSPAMLEITEHKVAGAERVDTAVWDASTPMPDQVRDGGPYDMVFSNFGAMNCVPDLSHFGLQIAQVMGEDGVVVLVLMNRWCGMELLLNLLLRNTTNMLRRLKRTPVATLEDGSRLPIWFPSVRAVRKALGPEFTLVARAPIGVFLPPSELYGSFQKRPRLLRLAKRLDATLGSIWPLSRLADHTLIALRYRPAT